MAFVGFWVGDSVVKVGERVGFFVGGEYVGAFEGTFVTVVGVIDGE